MLPALSSILIATLMATGGDKPMRTSLISLILLLLLDCDPAAAEERPWAFSVVRATLAQERLLQIFVNEHFFESSHLTSIRLSRRFGGSTRGLAWEVEGQVVKHDGKQSHWEFNPVLIARWHRFPWKKFMDTTVALGEGLSYASRTPRVEAEDHERTSQLLNYLLFELTIGLPRYPRWQASGIIHHRSGVFGLFNGVRGGSNFMGGGIKYLF